MNVNLYYDNSGYGGSIGTVEEWNRIATKARELPTTSSLKSLVENGYSDSLESLLVELDNHRDNPTLNLLSLSILERRRGNGAIALSSNSSWFSRCPRDERGWCMSSDEGGGGGGKQDYTPDLEAIEASRNAVRVTKGVVSELLKLRRSLWKRKKLLSNDTLPHQLARMLYSRTLRLQNNITGIERYVKPGSRNHRLFKTDIEVRHEDADYNSDTIIDVLVLIAETEEYKDKADDLIKKVKELKALHNDARQMITGNIFCSTGEGGGVDPSCKKGDSRAISSTVAKVAKTGLNTLKNGARFIYQRYGNKKSLIVGGIGMALVASGVGGLAGATALAEGYGLASLATELATLPGVGMASLTGTGLAKLAATGGLALIEGRKLGRYLMTRSMKGFKHLLEETREEVLEGTPWSKRNSPKTNRETDFYDDSVRVITDTLRKAGVKVPSREKLIQLIRKAEEVLDSEEYKKWLEEEESSIPSQETRNASFFSTCDRDRRGWCLSKDEGGGDGTRKEMPSTYDRFHSQIGKSSKERSLITDKARAFIGRLPNKVEVDSEKLSVKYELRNEDEATTLDIFRDWLLDKGYDVSVERTKSREYSQRDYETDIVYYGRERANERRRRHNDSRKNYYTLHIKPGSAPYVE